MIFTFFPTPATKNKHNIEFQRYDLGFRHTFGHLALQVPCACHETWKYRSTKYCACHEKWNWRFNK